MEEKEKIIDVFTAYEKNQNYLIFEELFEHLLSNNDIEKSYEEIRDYVSQTLDSYYQTLDHYPPDNFVGKKDIYNRLFQLYFRNIGGNTFNLKLAQRYSEIAKKDKESLQLIEDIEKQKKIDKEKYLKPQLVDIPSLKKVLENANSLIVSYLEDVLKRKLSNKVRNSLKEVNIVFSYEKKKYQKKAYQILKMFYDLIKID